MKICKVEGCGKKHDARGYCSKHYFQMMNHGRIFNRNKFDLNEIIVHEDYAEIVLYKGRGEQVEAARTKIDLEDVEIVKGIKWRTMKNGDRVYAINNKMGLLHRVIMKAGEGNDVDHINHDCLDNRKENLRICSRQENMMNMKGAKGYYFYKRDKKWIVRIQANGKNIIVGRFHTEEEAKRARRGAEIMYFGEFRYKKRPN